RLRIAKGSGVSVSEVNDLVTRFFEARKMMKQMAGQFGFGGGSRSATKKLAKSRKGKKGKGRPTPSRTLPAGAGMPDLSGLPPSLQQLPPGLDKLPPGFDPSKLKFPKGK
ncbi:MAG: signal recognition particle protein, partial [Sciscionella sp.]